MGRGYPLPSRLGDLGERREAELPQRVRFLKHILGHRMALAQGKNATFCLMLYKILSFFLHGIDIS